MNQINTILQQINDGLTKIEAEDSANTIKKLQKKNQELEQLLLEASQKLDTYIQAINEIMQSEEPEKETKIAVNE